MTIPCRKISYLDKACAETMVRRMKAKTEKGVCKENKRRLHAYLCPRCGFWHVGKHWYPIDEENTET